MHASMHVSVHALVYMHVYTMPHAVKIQESDSRWMRKREGGGINFNKRKEQKNGRRIESERHTCSAGVLGAREREWGEGAWKCYCELVLGDAEAHRQ